MFIILETFFCKSDWSLQIRRNVSEQLAVKTFTAYEVDLFGVFYRFIDQQVYFFFRHKSKLH